MKTYWLVVLALALADAAVVALLLLKDGGPEGPVWWAFLIIPLLIAALVVVGLILLAIHQSRLGYGTSKTMRPPGPG